MVSIDEILAWTAMGGAASLGGRIWPFRRGLVGVFLNVVVAVVGALGLGLLSGAFLPRAHAGATRLAFAALGAIVALLLSHAVWSGQIRQPGA
jgi:uncharacterized membrane protein YeaQ/YmgE (transglycosylase-associated protein family)